MVAAREPASDAGFFTKLWAQFGKVVIVRKVDPAGTGVDGLLARAQSQASAGDLENAVQTLRRLPPAARAQLADWLAAADRRIEIDQHIAAVRAGALADLTPAPAGADAGEPKS
ncbi:MAG: mitofilin family membrane protein [Caulobacteraceae bacterium]